MTQNHEYLCHHILFAPCARKWANRAQELIYYNWLVLRIQMNEAFMYISPDFLDHLVIRQLMGGTFTCMHKRHDIWNDKIQMF